MFCFKYVRQLIVFSCLNSKTKKKCVDKTRIFNINIGILVLKNAQQHTF